MLNEIDMMLLAKRSGGGGGGMSIVPLSEGQYDPETGIPTIENPLTNTIYIAPNTMPSESDLYIEWIYVNNAWEKFGSASIDVNPSDVVYNGLVNNKHVLTDEEQLKIETWLALDQNYLSKTNHTFYPVNDDYIPAHKKYVDDQISERGGGTVIANPDGEATDDLVKIEINGVIYDIKSGGGSDAVHYRVNIPASGDHIWTSNGPEKKAICDFGEVYLPKGLYYLTTNTLRVYYNTDAGQFVSSIICGENEHMIQNINIPQSGVFNGVFEVETSGVYPLKLVGWTDRTNKGVQLPAYQEFICDVFSIQQSKQSGTGYALTKIFDAKDLGHLPDAGETIEVLNINDYDELLFAGNEQDWFNSNWEIRIPNQIPVRVFSNESKTSFLEHSGRFCEFAYVDDTHIHINGSSGGDYRISISEIYGIKYGSNDSPLTEYCETVLYDNPDGIEFYPNSIKTIQLAESFKHYQALFITAAESGTSNYRNTSIIPTSSISIESDYYINTYCTIKEYATPSIKFNSETEVSLRGSSSDTPMKVYKIVGVKYGQTSSNNTYSTEEQIVGTWIDGKPIYRRVVVCEGIYYKSGVVKNVTDWNVDSTISCDCETVRENDSHERLPYVHPQYMGSTCTCNFTRNTIHLYFGSDYSTSAYVKKATFILEYTKTTD